MEILTYHKNNKIWYSEYPDKKLIDFPFDKPFIGMIWNNMQSFVDTKLIAHFIDNNCLHFIVGGENCLTWEVEADCVCVESQLHKNKKDKEVIGTSSHKDIEEMIFYGLYCANGIKPTIDMNYLFLQIGSNYSKEDIVKMMNQEF